MSCSILSPPPKRISSTNLGSAVPVVGDYGEQSSLLLKGDRQIADGCCLVTLRPVM